VCQTFDDSLITIKRKSRAKTEPELADAVDFVRTRLGFSPDAKQIEILQSTAKRGILNCSRQWGKSTVTAAKAVHRAYAQAGSVILVASPSERQSAEFLRKAKGMVRKLGIRARGDGDNAASLLLPNGSRIVGLPGNETTVRGFSAVSLILIDEAARVQDEMYSALRPMLAVGDGDLWLMSTPCGQRGFFYETWVNSKGGGEEWMRVSVPATECSRITGEFLNKERRTTDSATFSQEYMCEFTTDGTEVFDRQSIEDAFDGTVTELSIG
jgi:terminase large subunit-like protein